MMRMGKEIIDSPGIGMYILMMGDGLIYANHK